MVQSWRKAHIKTGISESECSYSGTPKSLNVAPTTRPTSSQPEERALDARNLPLQVQVFPGAHAPCAQASPCGRNTAANTLRVNKAFML